MRQLLILALALLFSCSLALSETIPEAEPGSDFLSGEGIEAEASGAILIEACSGRVLYEKNADEMLPMASTTKIMTCLITLEHASLSELVTASENAYGTTGTSIYLSEGETLTMEQMLYGLMLRSGNDAAVAVAEHVAGSTEAFAALMNARAVELGVDAHFINPHGLDAEGHAASARAMAYIMREALKNETFVRIASTQKKIIPWPGNVYSRVLQNKNRLLSSYEGALAGKTGYTSIAGRCLVFSAERDGMLLIGALLNCPTWFDTAQMLLDYGYEYYALEPFYEEGEVVDQLSVSGGQRRKVDLVAATELAFPLEVGETYEIGLQIPEEVRAPVTKGDLAGRAVVSIDGVEIASIDLLYANDVPMNNMEAALHRLIDAWLLIF